MHGFSRRMSVFCRSSSVKLPSALSIWGEPGWDAVLKIVYLMGWIFAAMDMYIYRSMYV